MSGFQFSFSTFIINKIIFVVVQVFPDSICFEVKKEKKIFNRKLISIFLLLRESSEVLSRKSQLLEFLNLKYFSKRKCFQNSLLYEVSLVSLKTMNNFLSSLDCSLNFSGSYLQHV